MSRLADLLSSTLAPPLPGLNAGLGNSPGSGAVAGERGLPDFQALFAQELAAQPPIAAQFPLPAGLTGDPAKEGEDGKELAKTLEIGAGNAPELVVWMPWVSPQETLTPSTAATLASGAAGIAKANGAKGAGLAPEAQALRAAQGPREQNFRGLPATPAFDAPPGAKTVAPSLEPARIETLAVATPFAETAALASESRVSASGAATETATLVQTLAVPAAAPAAPAPAANVTVQAPFGSPAWREDFGEQIVFVSRQEVGNAQLKLNPPQLGPIEVSISVQKDVAEASFVVTSAPVKEAVEAAIPRLREMFAEAGLSLGQTFVSQDPGQAKQAFAQSGGGDGRRESGSGGGETGSPAEVVAAVRKRGLGRVDTFA
ncbi:MAG: hypothetical protein F9K47_05695 [Burkholderiales bacterium]|nr:MAG: hypothetical protein F9K47_05695 [Burkholderiales bacterium]